MLFPSLLESTFFIHNLFSLCLVLGVLHLDEPIQVLAIGLLFEAGVCVARLFSVSHLGLQINQVCSLLLLFFLVHLLDDVDGLLRAEVRLLVLAIFGFLHAASVLVLLHLSENIFLILLVGLQLEVALRHGKVLLLLDVVEEVVSLLVALVGQLHEVLLEAVVSSLAGVALVGVHFFALVLGVSVNGVGPL